MGNPIEIFAAQVAGIHIDLLCKIVNITFPYTMHTLRIIIYAIFDTTYKCVAVAENI